MSRNRVFNLLHRAFHSVWASFRNCRCTLREGLHLPETF